MITCKKKVNNFQIAKVQAEGVVYLLLDILSLMLLRVAY